MVELAKPLSWASPSGGMVDVFLACDIAAEREQWQKEVKRLQGQCRTCGAFILEPNKKIRELQAALDKEVVRADCLLKALKTTENILSDTKAALDKVEDTIVATMKRADKAEARVRELEAALYKKGKWNPEIDEVERILRNAIDKSLPKEARLKK